MERKAISAKRSHPQGPEKWCKRCSRKHRTGAVCDLYLRQRAVEATDGEGAVVQKQRRVWAH